MLPPDILLDHEHIIHETKLHWISLFKEILYSVALIAGLIVLWVWLEVRSGWILLAMVVVWAGLSFRGVTDWFTTAVGLTNQRVIFRQGLFSKKGYEIPVEMIQDVAFRKSALQNLFGAGDLLVKSAASGGSTAIRNVPDPELMRRLIAETRQGRVQDRLMHGTLIPDPGKTRAEQLQILSDLLDQGKITAEEYDLEKARLLGDQ
jgi:uncharacterized membrane protein YdbT with pleckstrin-like domain